MQTEYREINTDPVGTRIDSMIWERFAGLSCMAFDMDYERAPK
jgi:hypothetical protein